MGFEGGHGHSHAKNEDVLSEENNEDDTKWLRINLNLEE
jgi:hypothetical protein